MHNFAIMSKLLILSIQEMVLLKKSSGCTGFTTNRKPVSADTPKNTHHEFGKNLKPWKRILFLSCGFVALTLGLIGIPLPLLPTTPFLLLAAWFFAMSSKRFYIWLTTHRIFGRIITDYHEQGGVRRIIKIRALTLLWATILSSAIFFTDQWGVRILLLAVALGVTLHIRKIKTLK